MTRYSVPEKRNQDNNWHLDKKVPISIILLLFTQGVSGLWVIADIKKDVEILKVQSKTQNDRDDRQDRSAQEAYQLLRGQLEKMDLKLDRLVEKR